MIDPRINKMAKVLVNYSVSVKKGQTVLILGNPGGAPLLKEIYKEVLKAGGHPNFHIGLDGINEIFLKNASEKQLQYVSPSDKYKCKFFDVMISVDSSKNTKSLTNISPKIQAIRMSSFKPLNEIVMKREAKGWLKLVGCLFPTHAYAQDAEMSLDEFAEFAFDACKLNYTDPVKEWKKLSGIQEKIIKYLNKVNKMKVIAKDTELNFSVKGRKWINCDGKINFPDGEVFTGPIENSMEGKVKFSFPACYGGREVAGIHLEFKKGKVVKAEAQKGEDFLHKMIEMDKGSKYVGEFAFGTNNNIKHLTKEILFDEKIGGTFHMALGESYPRSGGKNKSALHWDMICDMKKGGKIFADGKLIYKEGKFLI